MLHAESIGMAADKRIIKTETNDASWQQVVSFPHPQTDSYINLHELSNGSLISQTPVTYRLRSIGYNPGASHGYGPLFGHILVQKFLTTDLNKNAFKQRVIIYPNPVKDNMNICTNKEIVALVIRAISGVVVRSYFLSGKAEANISDLNLANGIYEATVTFTDGTSKTERLAVGN